MENLTAKDDVDNVGAGRAAKGENPGRSFFAIPSLRSLLPRPKNAGNRSNFLHFLFIFICLFSHQTLQGEILFATYNNVFYYAIYC